MTINRQLTPECLEGDIFSPSKVCKKKIIYEVKKYE